MYTFFNTHTHILTNLYIYIYIYIYICMRLFFTSINIYVRARWQAAESVISHVKKSYSELPAHVCMHAAPRTPSVSRFSPQCCARREVCGLWNPSYECRAHCTCMCVSIYLHFVHTLYTLYIYIYIYIYASDHDSPLSVTSYFDQ